MGRQAARYLWSAASAVLGVGAVAATAANGANVVFQNVYTDASGTGFNNGSTGAAAQAALTAAENAWASRLTAAYSGETIVVDAHYISEGGTASSAPLANAGPETFFALNTTTPNYSGYTYYAAPLANHLQKSDQNGPATEEIDVNVNSDIGSSNIIGGETFYYGTDGKPKSNQIDFESVVTHEIGHGLGILSLINQDGSEPTGTLTNTSGGTTTINIPSIYDTFLKSGSSLLINDTQAARAATLTGGALYFTGANAVAGYASEGYNAANGVPIYAPSTYQAGSSTSHVDQSVFDLMDPVYPGVDHTPSAIDFGILADEGWDVSAAPEPTSLAMAAIGAMAVLGRRRHRSGRRVPAPR